MRRRRVSERVREVLVAIATLEARRDGLVGLVDRRSISVQDARQGVFMIDDSREWKRVTGC